MMDMVIGLALVGLLVITFNLSLWVRHLQGEIDVIKEELGKLKG